MTIHVEHRIQMAVDCECGTTVEACDEEELFDELLEHIAAAHDTANETGTWHDRVRDVMGSPPVLG